MSEIGSIESGLKTIDLEGVFLDGAEGARVDVTTERFLDKSMTEEFLSTVEDMVKSHPVTKEKTEDVEKAITTTLCAEESSSRELATPSDLAGYADLKNYFKEPQRPPLSLKDSPLTLLPAARYAEASWRACYRRKFFITAAGRMGIGPQTMREGDVVVVLYGGEWPFVLRERVGDGGQWEMVGLAYIFGIMGGQAIRKAEERGGEDRWFCLR